MKQIDSDETYKLDDVIFLGEMTKLVSVTGHTIRRMIKNDKVTTSILYHHRRFWLLTEAYQAYKQIINAKKNNKSWYEINLSEEDFNYKLNQLKNKRK